MYIICRQVWVSYMLSFSLGTIFYISDPLLLHSYIEIVNMVYMVVPFPTTITSSDTYTPRPSYTLQTYGRRVKKNLEFDEIFIIDNVYNTNVVTFFLNCLTYSVLNF